MKLLNLFICTQWFVVKISTLSICKNLNSFQEHKIIQLQLGALSATIEIQRWYYDISILWTVCLSIRWYVLTSTYHWNVYCMQIFNRTGMHEIEILMKCLQEIICYSVSSKLSIYRFYSIFRWYNEKIHLYPIYNKSVSMFIQIKRYLNIYQYDIYCSYIPYTLCYRLTWSYPPQIITQDIQQDLIFLPRFGLSWISAILYYYSSFPPNVSFSVVTFGLQRC